MKTKIKWRLAERPTPSEISLLVEKELLTKDEGRQILFSLETEEDRDKKSLESEIKFLRELVERLSSRSQIVEVIKEVQKPYYQYGWSNPYTTWCNAVGSTESVLTTSNYTLGNGLTVAGTGSLYYNDTSQGTAQGFSEIKTF